MPGLPRCAKRRRRLVTDHVSAPLMTLRGKGEAPVATFALRGFITTALSFWASSRGGFETPYIRPSQHPPVPKTHPSSHLPPHLNTTAAESSHTHSTPH